MGCIVKLRRILIMVISILANKFFIKNMPSFLEQSYEVSEGLSQKNTCVITEEAEGKWAF
ncbi:MAG: hypothetical protein EA343_09480 [Nodularia sp. (in: Bacteria)]|nr:MAG: hypothetical protein EA343_09480 [Nodularia sp. (in: cyanobacteria)]